MPIHIDPRLRAAVMPLAVGMYLLPPTVGIVAGLSHIAYHLREAIEAQEEQAAAALGLPPSPRPESRLEPEGHHGFVHTHDGVTHHHSAGMDALLAASGRADTEMASTSATSMEVSTHLPAVGLAELPAYLSSLVSDRRRLLIRLRAGPRPPLPPPRA